MTGGTINLAVNAANDDVNEDGATFDAGSTSLWIGNASSTGASYTGLRFNTVAIPRGARITAAQLQFYSTTGQWLTINVQIAGENVDSSAAFSTTSRPSARALTVARIAHSSNVQWLTNTWYSFNDMSAVVQEIVNRPGWQSGNSMGVILRGTSTSPWGRKFAASFERGAATAVRLVITYTVP